MVIAITSEGRDTEFEFHINCFLRDRESYACAARAQPIKKKKVLSPKTESNPILCSPSNKVMSKSTSMALFPFPALVISIVLIAMEVNGLT